MKIQRDGHELEVVDLNDSEQWEAAGLGPGGFWERFSDGRWEPDTLALVEKLAPGRTFVDIGAWVGAISMWAHIHGCARLYAVECDPIALPMLRANLANNVEGGYVLAHDAIWVETGETTMAPDGKSTTRVGVGGERVATMTLPDFWRAWNLRDAVVKMDIEGAETAVLDQDSKFLAEQGCELILSVHPWVPRPHCLDSGAWDWDRVEDDTYHLWPSG